MNEAKQRESIMRDISGTSTYVQLKPCVDHLAHAFTVAVPAPGNFGYAFTYCTRCGLTQKELRK